MLFPGYYIGMISTKHRFHGYGSLKRVYQQGQTVRGPNFSLKYLPNPKRQSYRLAVVVSRKVSKSAVVRNRIRRRLYEAVRLHESDIIQPYDIVLSVYNEVIADDEPKRLQVQVKNQLQSAGILAKRVTR